jgi:hypothetical protein
MDNPLSNEEETQGMTTNEPPEVWLEATPNDQSWMENFGRLVLFREAHGHCNVPKKFEDKALFSWVANQKSFHRAGTLRKDREKLLNEIEFTWTAPARQDAGLKVPWMDRYNQLVAFKEKNGHLQVTAHDVPLRNWINGQRLLNRSGTLRQERKDLLDKIGFVWNVRKGRQKPNAAPVPKFDLTSVQNKEESWNQMFARLKAFYEQHGHTDVQANSDDLELLQWVSLQQNLHKLGHLDEKYEKALREIGLSWELQTLQDNATKNDRQMSLTREDELWLSQFRLLCEFQKQHGHTSVPRTGETSALAQWWFVQQRLLERGRLSEDKKKHLADYLGATSTTTAATTLGNVSREPPMASVNLLSTSGAVSSHAPASSRTAASMEVETVPVHDEVPSVKDAGHNFSNTSLTMITAETSSKAPSVQLPGPASQSVVNATVTDIPTEAMAPPNAESQTLRITQKFAIGTRIEKLFDVDGVLQVFGGNVYSFEQFEEDDGTYTWGYMIHYDDGDKEHMLETDVEKNLVVVKKQKRATKSHQNPKSSKRVKRSSPSSNEANSAPSTESKATTSAADDAARNSGAASTEGLKDPLKFSASSETKKASGEKGTGRFSRVRDAKLLRQSGEVTKESPATTVAKEKVLANSKPMNDLESDSSSSEDEPLHLLVRKQAHTGARKTNQGVDLEQLHLPDSPEVQTDATITNQEKQIRDELVRKDDLLHWPVSQQIQANTKIVNERTESQHEFVDKDHQLRLPVSQHYQSSANHTNQEKEIQHELADKDQQFRLLVSHLSSAKKTNHEKEIQHELADKDQQLAKQANQEIEIRHESSVTDQQVAKKANQEKEIHNELADEDQQQEKEIRHESSDADQQVAKKANQENEIHSELAGEDQQLQLPVSHAHQKGTKKANEAKEIQHEIVDLVDDEESTVGDPPQTLNETLNPPQQFPRGTTISRKFFDLSDNEREKSYRGKVIDFVYLTQEMDWFYFVQYDDGDTEFMDEWEVAKFSASTRS